jgi:hypothetical protein
MNMHTDDTAPRDALLAFLGKIEGLRVKTYPESRLQVLMNGLASFRRIQSGRRDFAHWRTLYDAYLVLTMDTLAELQAKGEIPDSVTYRDVDTTKGSPFQRVFLPRWEAFENLVPNVKALTKVERKILRELVREPKILAWREAIAPERQWALTHPYRLIEAYRRERNLPDAGKASKKTTISKTTAPKATPKKKATVHQVGAE